MNLQSPIIELKGIGSKSAEKFQKIGILTIEDLLLYYPFRYDDFKKKKVSELVDGEKAVITGTIVTVPNVQYYAYKRNRLSFKMKQGDVVIAVSFFNQSYLVDKLVLGDDIAVFGKWDALKLSLTGMKILTQVKDDLQPIYRVTQGISQTLISKAIKSSFEIGAPNWLTENLPQLFLERYHLLGRTQATIAMHFPKDLSEHHQALRRIKFEELFYFQMHLQILKEHHQSKSSGLSIPYNAKKVTKQLSQLPFDLTDGQKNSLFEILSDMHSSRHMNRLLQGDVGSGKTIVASMAMYASYTAGFQSALMVPTEILAEQHFETLRKLFPNLSIVLLTSGMKKAAKTAVLAAIADGSVHIIVGTHALIQESVTYHHLGLVITDEQHRFGVNQRRMFREKGENPDVLMMTATPIPRTLTITAFGEMDVSIINELPSGRKPIITRWVNHGQLHTVLDWVKKEIKKGAQVYVISPLIEESETLDLKNAVALHEELSHYFSDSARVDLIHGRMKNDEKEAIMQNFKEKRSHILVSTTVIEVGVNIPNATIMIIMDADRFGLSQLHQLRGRVGRGEKQSYAILVANPKTQAGKKRMQLMTETTDGFSLAEADLKMRGSGEIFGTRQSGIPEFQVSNIVEDYNILEEARRVASQIVSEKGWKENPKWQVILQNLQENKMFD